MTVHRFFTCAGVRGALANAGTLENSRRLLHGLGFEFVPARLPGLKQAAIHKDREVIHVR
jgi:hypothetical protein